MWETTQIREGNAMTGLISTFVGIIIVLIILGVLWWAIQQLLPLIPLPEPFRKIIYVLMVVILVLVVLWVILALLGAAGVAVPGPFRFSRAGISALGAASAGHLHRMLAGKK
jgi:hypothetical protein